MATSRLSGKLIEVMKAVDGVPKNGWNEFHRYAYPEEADILRAVRGKLAELGVLVLSSVENATKQGDITEVFTKHTFIDVETGEEKEIKWYGQGQDKGDKGAYKAETGSLKYVILKTFLIPTGDDPEKDGPSQRRNGKKSANGHEPSVPKTGVVAMQNGQKLNPDESTREQQDQIKKLSQEVGLNVERDILPKLRISWPPAKMDAEKIIKRLLEIQAEKG